MDKIIIIKKNTLVLFIINIVFLLSTVFFKRIFTKLEFIDLLVNIELVINIIILIIGFIFNVIFLVKPNKFDVFKSIIISIVLFVLIFILNIFLVIYINKSINKSYSDIYIKIFDHVKYYGYDKYNNIQKNRTRDLVIYKTYRDFNNQAQDIIIHNIYDKKGINYIIMNIYSDNDAFSSDLIKMELDPYITNFNYEINSEYINEAFNNRFKGSIKKSNANYRVTEIYEKNELSKLKVNIKVKIN